MRKYIHVTFLLLATVTRTLASEIRISGGCGLDPPHPMKPGHSHNLDIQVNDPLMGEVWRSLRVHLPAAYDKSVPTPLVFDVHGWTMDPISMEHASKFVDVADLPEGGFIVATPKGMDDNHEGWGSFNCSSTNGPLGPVCDTNRTKWGEVSCYESCGSCDPWNSCDWTSCYDDLVFTREIFKTLSEMLCLDLDSVHQSGISNGAQFSYFMVNPLSDILASIAPVAGSPMIGFGDLPSVPISLIDFHGYNDDVIPYDLDHSEGAGPHDSIIAYDGYYYDIKENNLRKWTTGMNCQSGPEEYPTSMDGVDDFNCSIWSDCDGGVEIVHCYGNHGHSYPFEWGENGGQTIEGTKILWNFMKNHRKVKV